MFVNSLRSHHAADAILSSNLQIPLKGVAIGNGWIDPPTQYKAYIDFAVAKNLVKTDSKEYKVANEIWQKCSRELKAAKIVPTGINECERIMNTLIEGLQRKIDGKSVCLNVYDIRLVDEFPACGMNWPPDLTAIKPYLRRKEVVGALHAGAKSEAWVECNSKVGGSMHNKNSAASITILPALLEKIDVMFFAGDQDYICNHLGIEAIIENLTWGGVKGFGDAETSNWVVDGQPAGTWTASRKLTYVKVYNSSHMVPYDVPHAAHDMMLRFMGVDFNAIASGSVSIPSNVGNSTKPVVKPNTGIVLNGDSTDDAATKTPEDEKAKWDAYYNTGSIAVILFLIGLGFGLYFFCRNRRRRLGFGSSAMRRMDDEEAIPLADSDTLRDKGETDEQWRARKGKGRADPDGEKVVFDVGEDEDDDHEQHPPRRVP